MKFYFVYKTTNIINGKIYVGVHQTDDLNDTYLGSGIILNRAIKKYGRENFQREIVKMFDCLEDAYILESEIVNQDFIARHDVYNKALGGNGGSILQNRKPFCGNHSEESKKKISRSKLGQTHSDETKQQMSKNSWSKTNPDAQRKHASKAAKASHSSTSKRLTSQTEETNRK
jgi:group I intron endonuclease